MTRPRRSPSEVAEMKDRQASIASDNLCLLLYDAEKTMRDLAAYCGQFRSGEYYDFAEKLMRDRVTRWAKEKAKREQS